MLKSLTVENYALIESLKMDLDAGLNIVTGETGAGKSILLGALGMLLGSRMEVNALKDKEKNCVVEGLFNIDGYGLEPFFTANEIDYEPTSTIRRVVTPSGKSRAYVNDLPIQLNILKELGARLIDIHSQHQSMMIGDDLFRLGILDSVGGNEPLNGEYREKYELLRNRQRELERVLNQAQESRRDEEYLKFQVDELSKANLRIEEQGELEESMLQLSHAQEIIDALQSTAMLLGEEQTGIMPILKNIEHTLSKLKAIYSPAQEFTERIHQVLIELQEMERELESKFTAIESNPTALQKVSNRLDLLYSLQQKHHVSNMTELVALQKSYTFRLLAIVNSGEAIEMLRAEIEKIEMQAKELATRITKSRTEAAQKVSRHTELILKELGIPNGQFVVQIDPSPTLKVTGGDNVQFLFSANKNEAPMAVEKIASGGEISRLMLALKSLVAKTSRLPTIIFDEIDTGVSGHIADRMGEIINRMAGTMQIVNITHLPQVACKGKTHFLVYKDESGHGSQTLIKLLSPRERSDEIAKMLSGALVTEAALSQAKMLLDGSAS